MASSSLIDIREEAARIELELRRRRWARDPTLWVSERLKETIWSGQTKILNSVRDYRRTAVKSCHEVGKSFIAGRVAGWWLDTHIPGEAVVLTTAPTGPQVSAILWKEIGRVHTKGNLAGRTNQTNWWIPVTQANGLAKEELVAFGRKPADMNPSAFQGIHAKYLLVLVDEACGVSGQLWEAIDSLIANDQSKIVLLGNPDFPETEFEGSCKVGSGYNVVQIGAFDTPIFSGESCPATVVNQLIGRSYVEEKRRRWAPTWTWVDKDNRPSDPEHGVRCAPPDNIKLEDIAPYWASKVLGQFPVQSAEQGLIPSVWIRAAMERNLPPGNPVELGVDVGAGGDSSTIAHRRGPVVRIIHEDHNPDTMQTCGKVIAVRKSLKASAVKIDKIGIGLGIYDRATELKEPVYGINVGESASDSENYLNFKAEAYWLLRERFEAGDIDLDINDADTAAELVSLRYKRTSSGKIQIESKDQARQRGVPSPNRAEAVMLAFAQPIRGGSIGVIW